MPLFLRCAQETGPTNPITKPSHNARPADAYAISIQACKADRQYLLTLQVSRYCLLALQSSVQISTSMRDASYLTIDFHGDCFSHHSLYHIAIS